MSVAVTPNGRADAVTELPPGRTAGSDRCFCLPLEERMPFSRFLDMLTVQIADEKALTMVQQPAGESAAQPICHS